MTVFRVAVSAAFALAAGIVFAAPPVPDMAPVQVSEHVYVLHGSKERPNPQNQGFMNNPAIVLTGDGAVIVDPGGTAEVGRMVLRQLRKLTDKPVTDILVSHIHGDHWLASSVIREAFPKLRVHAHPQMIAAAKIEGPRWVDMMNQLTEGASQGTRFEVPESALADGQELAIGGLTFRVHLSELAHTNSDAMFELVQDKLIFLGDIGVYERMGRMEPDGHSSFRGNIAALERALALGLEHYVPGHGPSGGSDRASAFLDYLKIIYGAAEKGMEDGQAPFEIKEQVAPRVEAFSSWTGFEDNFGQQISLAVLEAEQAAF